MPLSEYNLPKNWQELVSLKEEIASRDMDFVRFDDDELFYQSYLKQVPQKTRHQILFNTLEGCDIKILRNAFPYSRLIQNIPNVHHYCLWNKKGKLTISEVENEIKKVFPNQDYFWFENSDIAKSIPEIWHCQIFVKTK